jgi:opacity protein-like surface antigen
MKKLLVSGLLLGFGVLSMMAQSGTKSPYSQYGLGVLSDQSQGFNRGMGGVFQGFRSGNQVNMQNPASYSAVDSLSMIFDLGVSGTLTNFKEGDAKVNAKTANFEYATALFRVLPKFGVSVGIVPYTNVGYSYSTKQKVGNSSTTTTTSFEGTGGFRQVYLGLGYEFFKGFSLGANISYFWGSYERDITVTSSDAYVKTIAKEYEAEASSYKLDFGAQYQHKIGKNDLLTVGATLGLGHKINADANLLVSNTDTQTGLIALTGDSIDNALSIPMTIGAGVSYNHNRNLIFGLDYQWMRWSKEPFPVVDEATNKFILKENYYTDRHKLSGGIDWIPAPMSRRFLNRVHYRFGGSYATPYLKIKGQDGPKELSLSAGFGIPLVNSWNNRSVLNVSFQWTNLSAKNLVTENQFRITIGLTFNERWFAKWKVD